MDVMRERFVQTNNLALNAVFDLATAQCRAMEQVINLSFTTLHGMLERLRDYHGALRDAKDPPELINLGGVIAQSALERLLDFEKGVCEVASQAQRDVHQLVEANTVQFKALLNLLDAVPSRLPAEASTSAMNSALAGMSSAYESFSKAAEQAAAIVDRTSISRIPEAQERIANELARPTRRATGQPRGKAA